MSAVVSLRCTPNSSNSPSSDMAMANVEFGSYPGGKGAPGVAQRLINLMPPHRVYIEPFLGAGAVMRRKRPAARNIGVDLDKAVVTQWQGRAHVQVHHQCGIEFLQQFPFQGDELIYCDPPYLFETRAAGYPYYRHEMIRDQHAELLECLLTLPCRVMISGYPSELYRSSLERWTHETYEVTTRGGMKRTECVWFNYARPLELHDYRYLGNGFRERERIRRRVQRWTAKLEQMPQLERQALLAALSEAWPRSAWVRKQFDPHSEDAVT